MNVMKIRKMWCMFIGVLLLTGIMGCSNSNGETQEEAKTGQEINLKFIWWGKDQRKEDTLKVIELYKKDHPNVNIITEDFSSTSEVATQLAIETADQNTADIIQGDYGFIFNYINRDLIEPLGPFVERKILSTSDIDPSYLTPGMKDDALYALPIAINSESFVYDPAFFEDAGVTVPTEDYTIEDLYATLGQLKQSIDSPDFYPLGNMFDANYYLRSRGVSLYNAEGTGLGYDDDKIMADYLSLYKKWIEEGLLSNGSLKRAGNDENHPVITGQSALYSVSSNASTVLSKVAGRTIKLLPLPQITGDAEGKFIKPSMFLAVSSYSKYPEEAVKFIDFFVNNVEANDILNAERGVPVSSVISARLSEKLDEAGKQQYQLLDYLKTHSSPIDPPAPSNAVVVDNAYQLILQHVVDGSSTPEQGAKEYRVKATKILQGTGEVSSK
jgi:multiple sugar transport system substrate-binding protein